MLHLKDAFQASSYFIYKYIVETSLLLHASTFDILSVSSHSKMMYIVELWLQKKIVLTFILKCLGTYIHIGTIPILIGREAFTNNVAIFLRFLIFSPIRLDRCHIIWRIYIIVVICTIGVLFWQFTMLLQDSVAFIPRLIFRTKIYWLKSGRALSPKNKGHTIF